MDEKVLSMNSHGIHITRIVHVVDFFFLGVYLEVHVINVIRQFSRLLGNRFSAYRLKGEPKIKGSVASYILGFFFNHSCKLLTVKILKNSSTSKWNMKGEEYDPIFLVQFSVINANV